jgi:DNA-directed RNA polymerase specialized sigma24 family protein
VELTRPGLTREGLDALLALLDPDRDRAGERYEALRRRLVKLFEWRGVRDPAELADETLDRVCRRIAGGEVIRADDPGAYVLGVARNVLRESWKKEARDPAAPLPDADRAPAAIPEGDEELERRLACLQSCLASLPPETSRLVLDYYGDGGGSRIRRRQGLAAALGIAASALRLRLHRVRVRLEACVARCLEGRPETQGGARPHDGEGGSP